MAIRVLHLVGSAQDGFFADLSRMYASGCLDALGGLDRYVTHVALVSPDGSWRFPTGLGDAEIAAADPMPLADAVARIRSLRVDVMVPQMFCASGMTHHRALFDLLGIPYVGNTATAMALTADKALARAVVAHAGVAVPEGEVVRRGDEPSLDPPVVVKPVDSDNSHGVSLVTDRGGFDGALERAWERSERALVERYVELGREVRCATLERAGRLACLPLEEYAVDRTSKPIRDAADKLARGADGAMGLVAKDGVRAWILDPADPVTSAVWDAARRCHVALGCRHYGLFDFRIDPDGRPWFLEAGLYCSFAPSSVVATMAEAAGIPLVDLFDSMVDRALAADPDAGGAPR